MMAQRAEGAAQDGGWQDCSPCQGPGPSEELNTTDPGMNWERILFCCLVPDLLYLVIVALANKYSTLLYS